MKSRSKNKKDLKNTVEKSKRRSAKEEIRPTEDLQKFSKDRIINSNLFTNKRREREPSEIIVNKKEIMSILNDINLNELIPKKVKYPSYEDDEQNESQLRNKKNTLIKNEIKIINEDKFNDAGSGAVMDTERYIKTEDVYNENDEYENKNNKQSILRLIMSDIQLCQFSDIFQAFQKEIENPNLLDYFWKLKESLINENSERLINTLLFLVWSLKFMKVDSSLLNTGKVYFKNLMRSENSFTIGGVDIKDKVKLKANSFSDNSDNSNNNSKIEKLPASPKFGGKSPTENHVFNQTFHQSKSGSENENCKSNIQNENNFAQGFENQNCPSNNHPIINYMGMTIPAFNPNYIIPFGFYPNIQMMNQITPQVQAAIIPSPLNTLGTSHYRTEVINSGNINTVESKKSKANKHVNNTYDQFMSINDSNNTLSSIINNFKKSKNNTNNSSEIIVKREHENQDYIDITVSNDKLSEEEFETVYKEVVSIFSQPISNLTFINLKKFLNEEQVNKLEEILKNPYSFTEKKQYILLFKNKNKEDLYLKVDPAEKKCSIMKCFSRGSKSKKNSKSKN